MPRVHQRSMLLGPLVTALCVLSLPAVPAALGDSGSVRIRERAEELIARKEIAGTVILVGRADTIVHVVAAGKRDLGLDLDMEPDTLFRIASMTKPVTALAVMMLADQGKLAIDDPVEKYLPEFTGLMLIAERSQDGATITLKKPKRPIALRDLLTHTSGMPDKRPPGIADLYVKRNHTLAEGVMAFSQRELEFEPGSKWSYCNLGFDTLGRIVEVVSGQSYESFLKQRIFDPLGMVDTTFYPSPEQLKRTALPYELKDGALRYPSRWSLGPPTGAKYPIPAGGLYSTAPDLARLYQMMLRGGTVDGLRLLSESSVAAMTRVQTGDLVTGFSEGMGFGLGWGVVRRPTGLTAYLSPDSYGHGGSFGTEAWIDPRRGLFVIMLIQRSGLRDTGMPDVRDELLKVGFEAH